MCRHFSFPFPWPSFQTSFLSIRNQLCIQNSLTDFTCVDAATSLLREFVCLNRKKNKKERERETSIWKLKFVVEFLDGISSIIMCFLTVNKADKSNFNRIYGTKIVGCGFDGEKEKFLPIEREMALCEYIYHFYAKHKWQINMIFRSRRQNTNWMFGALYVQICEPHTASKFFLFHRDTKCAHKAIFLISVWLS